MSKGRIAYPYLVGQTHFMPEAQNPNDRLPATEERGTEVKASPQSASDNRELQERRKAIRRGLRRSNYAVLAASVMVVLFALGALWLSSEAQHRAADALEASQRAEKNAVEAGRVSRRLQEVLARSAKLIRARRTIGQRTECIEAIREVALQPSRELRGEALSALLLPDVGTNLAWHTESGFESPAAYDANLEHFIMNNDRQAAVVRRSMDGAVLMEQKGFGVHTRFWQFSPDGQLAAIAFSGGEIGVWDWRQSNLVARIPSLDKADFGESRFAFAPDSRHLWLLTTNGDLVSYDLQNRLLTPALTPAHPGRFIHLSPSARFVAIASVTNEMVKNLEVWDLSSRTQRAVLTLTTEIWRIAWHPDEERLAVGCYGGLHLWNIGAPEVTALRPDGAITSLFFDADGDLLFTAGWDVVGEVWNVRNRHVILKMTTASPWQLSTDQTRLAIVQGRVGYGIQQYLPPVGLRQWLAPLSIGPPQWSTDIDPKEHRLLLACTGGWLVRDAESGRELARATSESTLAASFSSDGSNVIAWTSSGLQRWALAADDSPGSLTVGAPKTLWQPSGQPPNVGTFTTGGKFAACSQNGLITVVDLEEPQRPLPRQFQLQRGRDNGLFLSPDGHWLITGYHNQKGLDWYDTRTGKFLRRFENELLSGAIFNPNSGDLYTSTAVGYRKWDLETGRIERSETWRVPAPYERPVAFSPDGRLALIQASATAVQLYDLKTGLDFATLDLGETFGIIPSHWSRDGKCLFLFGNDGSMARLDLAELRRELPAPELDWPDEDPSREFGTASTAHQIEVPAAQPRNMGATGSLWRNPGGIAWLVWSGLLATICIGLYILQYQRRLVGGYLETERMAAQRETELRETQAALQHSEKMKALGTLSTGIAHDFNNILSIIRLSNELIEEHVQPQGVTKDNFNAIHQAIQRGRGIVNSMLGYARDDGQARHFTASELISDAVALLGKSFLGGLVLQVEVAPDTPALVARKGRVEQMLFNLIVNASEAMRGHGTLTLQARSLRESTPCLLPPAPANGFVELGVQDTGPGIPPDVLPRIFEPFFTTKTVGSRRGTGLGLSMLYTMAREEGIGVAVTTELGKGTTFRLLLPLEGAAVSRVADARDGHYSPIEAADQTVNPES